MGDTGIDFIGDIHGHVWHLKQLLERLGYTMHRGRFRPPARRHTVFVGDVIDRGPDVPAALQLVRRMVDSGDATLLMGNHELNALGFHNAAAAAATVYQSSGHRGSPHALRPRTMSRISQHQATLAQFSDAPGDLASHLQWFRELPLTWQVPGIRAVHAAWIPGAVAVLSSLASPLSATEVAALFSRGSELAEAVDLLIKGPEMNLPPGESFVDSDGQRRIRSRVAWWLDARGRSLGEFLFPFGVTNSPAPVPESVASRFPGYTDKEPVLLGHYWLTGPARLQSPMIAILDYSVARGGRIMAYRWDGEAQLDRCRMVPSDGELDDEYGGKYVEIATGELT